MDVLGQARSTGVTQGKCQPSRAYAKTLKFRPVCLVGASLTYAHVISLTFLLSSLFTVSLHEQNKGWIGYERQQNPILSSDSEQWSKRTAKIADWVPEFETLLNTMLLSSSESDRFLSKLRFSRVKVTFVIAYVTVKGRSER